MKEVLEAGRDKEKGGKPSFEFEKIPAVGMMGSFLVKGGGV